jgi:hypothetical protein
MYNAGQQAVCACDVLHGTATASSLRTWGLELGVLLHLVSRHRCAECCDKCQRLWNAFVLCEPWRHRQVTWRTSKSKSAGTSNFVTLVYFVSFCNPLQTVDRTTTIDTPK